MMIFLWISIVFIILVFSLDQLIERMYRYEKKRHCSTPEKYQIPFDEVHIPASGDAYLYGWWIPASPDASTLILVHGWGRNLARMMLFIQKLHPMGYNLLAFDARNHGSSSPVKRPTVGTFSEDTLAAVDFVAKSGQTSSHRIGVIGLSAGGGAAINAACGDQRIKSVITVGAISHPVEVMNFEFQKRRVPPFVAATLLTYMRFRFRLDFDKIAPVNNIPNVDAEIFIIHGDEDETVPLEQGRALEAAGKKEKTNLWIVPGKGHSDCDTHSQFWEKVSAFLHRTLPIS
jgi:pimeloyl-ACP methyl ester carboxylesterase